MRRARENRRLKGTRHAFQQFAVFVTRFHGRGPLNGGHRAAHRASTEIFQLRRLINPRAGEDFGQMKLGDDEALGHETAGSVNLSPPAVTNARGDFGATPIINGDVGLWPERRRAARITKSCGIMGRSTASGRM
jgi:hypothetical protein